MFIPIWLYFTVIALLVLSLLVIWYGGCKINQLQEEKETLASLVPQLQEYAQQLQKTHAEEISQLRSHHGAQTAKLQEDARQRQEARSMEIHRVQGAINRALQTQLAAHEEELAQLRAYHGKETAKLRADARQRQEAHAKEISRLKAAMDRALQTQRAAHEEEFAQLRAYHGGETAKLLKTISRMKPASDEGMVEFDELEELWNKALKSTNATLRRRIKVLETQVFENPEVIRLGRKVKNQQEFMNRAARTIEILYAALRKMEEDPSLEVKELLAATRP